MLKEEMKEIEKIKIQERFINPLWIIIGGTFVMIFGLFLMYSNLSPYILTQDQLFLTVLKYFGLIIALQGGIGVMRGIIGNNEVRLHQFLKIIQVLISLSSMGLLIMLYNNPVSIPFYYYDELSKTLILIQSPFEMKWIQLAIVILIALVILGAISDIYKAGKLEKYK
ncbi:MAG: hypothetical protein ACTSYC_04845 [Promethearchaeota archaeon]